MKNITWTTRIAQPGTMLEVVNQDKDYICSLLGNNSDEEKQANARLIAAAPELLEALKLAEIALTDFLKEDYPVKSVLREIRAAIQKAEKE